MKNKYCIKDSISGLYLTPHLLKAPLPNCAITTDEGSAEANAIIQAMYKLLTYADPGVKYNLVYEPIDTYVIYSTATAKIIYLLYVQQEGAYRHSIYWTGYQSSCKMFEDKEQATQYCEALKLLIPEEPIVVGRLMTEQEPSSDNEYDVELVEK